MGEAGGRLGSPLTSRAPSCYSASMPDASEPDARYPFSKLVQSATALTLAARKRADEDRVRTTLAAAHRSPAVSRLRAAPEEDPAVDPPPILRQPPPHVPDHAAGWRAGRTLALDLADWVVSLEDGYKFSVGADLWVWITLREGHHFRTEASAVEDFLAHLCDAESAQRGKSYGYEPRGGRVAPTGRAAREGLVYGAGSALAWAAPAPWHYVARSRASSPVARDELLGRSLTIAPTEAGAALANWARAYAAPGSGEDRWAKLDERNRERKRLWREYKAANSPGAEHWQVGF